ncbi:kinase-like domain-containing protein [Mycena epipterygia]|nr:kinase-like domain-containing protein [Mycena epipterygia]
MANQIDGVWTGQYMQGGHSTTFNASIKRMSISTVQESGVFSGDGEDDMGHFDVFEGSFASPNDFSWKQHYSSNGKVYEYNAQFHADGDQIYGTWLDPDDQGSNKIKLSRSLINHSCSTECRAVLPILRCSIDDALANLDTQISPWENAAEWLHADTTQLSSIVQEIIAVTGKTEIEPGKFPGVIIYQRLIVYIFAHLMLCTHNERALSDFKQTLKQWHDSDSVAILENHQQIKGLLLAQLAHSLKPLSELSAESTMRRIIALGDIALAARLALAVTNDTMYQQLLTRNGPGAQALLNLLQARFSIPIPINLAYKRRHLKALIKLSRASRLYPECLTLTGVEIGDDPIAAGGFGDVFKGNFRGEKIAVKILRIFRDKDMDGLLKDFSTEVAIWRQLSHANVVPFYGVYRLEKSSSRLCLVCPWMENGHLVHFLTDHPNTNCVPLSLDVAQGLAYLHSEKVIHGDLKAFNILVSQSGRAYIADFGLASVMESKLQLWSSTMGKGGTPRWQAPELFQLDTGAILRNTSAADVYAFGMVCYEMFTGNHPFHDIKMDFMVYLAVQKGERPSRPPHDFYPTRGLNDDIWHMIQICWASEPSERPHAGDVVEKLRSLVQSLDERQLDNFNVSFSSEILHNSVGSPFSTLLSLRRNQYV